MFEDNEVEVLVGTYEDYVVGYRVESQTLKKKQIKTQVNSAQHLISLEQSFAVRAHSGSVRCLATSSNGNQAVSLGSDETTNLFNLKRRKLQQTFESPSSCASFVNDTHAIFGCEDGTVQIYEIKKGTIELAKSLKGHKDAVISLSVHPSGKVLLSISKDLTMRTWNLIKGRCAYVTNLGALAHLVSWSKTGEEFMIAANNEIYLYNNEGNLEHSIKLNKRINSVEFITTNNFIVASDSGDLELFDLKEGKSIMRFKAHEVRVKCVKCIQCKSSPNQGDADDNQEEKLAASVNVHFVTASSDGVIKLWSMNTKTKGSLKQSDNKQFEEPLELAKIDTGARLTCMTTVVRKLEGA